MRSKLFSFLFLCLLCFLSGCKNYSGNKNKKDKVVISQKSRLALMRLMPDPHQKLIPDSMKFWVDTLTSAWLNDQRYRSLTDEHLMMSHKEEQLYLDSINTELVSKFLDQYGWPSRTNVGFKGRSAVAIIIQHAPLAVQEEYLPMLREARQKDWIFAEALAMLEDRILARNGRMQKYGTQLVRYKNKLTLHPVYNVDSLDSRRKEIGLILKVENYLNSGFNTEWNLEKYKEILPELMKLYKVQPGLPAQ